MNSNAVQPVRNRPDLEPRIVNKIVDDNARALSGL